jgi:hypothetical protein
MKYSRRTRAFLRAWYASLLLISLGTFRAAVWAHVESLRGLDPRRLLPDIRQLQVLLDAPAPRTIR